MHTVLANRRNVENKKIFYKIYINECSRAIHWFRFWCMNENINIYKWKTAKRARTAEGWYRHTAQISTKINIKTDPHTTFRHIERKEKQTPSMMIPLLLFFALYLILFVSNVLVVCVCVCLCMYPDIRLLWGLRVLFTFLTFLSLSLFLAPRSCLFSRIFIIQNWDW